MIVILSFLLVVSLVLNVALVFLLQRAAKRLLEFDELFELFIHDIDTNVKYFEKLLGTPILMNSPEVFEMNKNMALIKVRLQEFVNRMQESTNRNPPVVK